MAENLSVGIVIGAALGSTFSSTFQTVEQRSKRLGDTLKQARIGAGLTGDVVKYKQQLDQLKRRQAQAGASGKSLSVEIGRVERRYRAAARKAKNYGLEVGAAARQHRQFSRTAREAEQSLGRLQRRQNRQAKRQNLRSRALPMVGGAFAVAAPIKGAIKFESVMADVKKVVNFDSPEQFKSMGRDILQLSEVIPMAAGGLADIVAAAGQAGIARSELLRFAEDAAKMGVAFDMSGKEAGGAMTGLRTQFQLNQDQVVSLGDAYNHLSNNMDATARDMLNVASRTGSTAQLVGLTGQQVGALASTFLALKTPSEVAGTGINALMLRLATANKQGRKFQDALAGIGLDAMGLKQSIKQDAQGALLSFLEAVKSSDDVVGTLSDLFGAEYADDMAKLVGNLGLYRKALGLVANETKFAGSMQKEYEERAKTTANDLQLLRNQFNRLGVNLGTVLLPAVRDVGSELGWLAGGAADLADRFPGTTKAVVGLTLGLGGLVATAWVGSYTATLVGGAWDSAKFSAKKLGEAATWSRARLVAFNRTALVTATRTKALAVGGAIQSFGSSLIGLATRAIPAAIVGLKALTLAALSNPFVLIGVAVAGVAVLIWKYWEPIKAFLIGLWPPVKAAFTAVWEGIKSFFVSFHPLGLLISNWAPIVGFFGRLWTGIQSVFSAAWEGIKGFFLNYHPVGLVIKHWAPIVGFFGRLWTGIQSVFSAAWEGIKGFFLNYHPVGLVIKHWAPIVGFFGRLWTGIQSVFSAAWEGIKGFFLNYHPVGLVIKHWAPIVGFFGRLWTGIQSVFSAAWEGIKGFFLNYHPVGLVIKHWAPIVGFFGRLWTGIQSVFSAAWEGIKGFFLNYHPVGLVIKHWAPIVGFFGRLWTGIQSVFSAAWEGIKGFFLNYHPVGLVIKHWAPIVGFFGRLWTGIQSVFSAAWEGVVDWFGSLSLYEVGAAILTTLGEGIGSAIGWLGDKVKGVFGSIRKLLPFSDAKEGPLSGLTKSGQSILGTLGEGIRQAGPVALQRPLARTLGAATAGLALTVPASIALAASPLAAQPAPVFSLEPQAAPTSTTRPAGHTIHYHYGQNQITIHQQPNEDPQALAERILREMTRLQKQRRREEVYDGL